MNVTAHVTVNMTLKVAGATQTVQVSSQNTTLQTQDATTGQVINKRFIEDLPWYDRYVMNLVDLTPGVTAVDDRAASTAPAPTSFPMAAATATADVLMDGASITNFDPNGGIDRTTSIRPRSKPCKNSKSSNRTSAPNTAFPAVRSSTWSLNPAQIPSMAACTTLSATQSSTRTTGLPITMDADSRPAATTMAAPIGGPIFKNKTFFFFDYDGTRR